MSEVRYSHCPYFYIFKISLYVQEGKFLAPEYTIKCEANINKAQTAI